MFSCPFYTDIVAELSFLQKGKDSLGVYMYMAMASAMGLVRVDIE